MRPLLILERLLAAVLATLIFWLPVTAPLARAQEFTPPGRMPLRDDGPRGLQKVREIAVDRARPAERESLQGEEAQPLDVRGQRLLSEQERNQKLVRGGTLISRGDVVTPKDEPPAIEPVAGVGGVSENPEAERTLPSGDAKTAVSSEKLALPSGEGSIQGMGESFTPDLSSGSGSYSVPIVVPEGRASVQPSLTLSYSTTGGDGLAGIGWSLGFPFISRQTDKGLPSYIDGSAWHAQEDTFMYNGGQELVPVDSNTTSSIDGGTVPQELVDWQQYRSRVEGGFLRFFRSPDSTRWVVQAKDGTRFDFGACPPGEENTCTPAVQADPELPTHIFSWPLVRMSDAHGSTVQFRYFTDRGTVYPLAAYYTTPARCGAAMAAEARRCAVDLSEYAHRVGLVYESRSDVTSSYATTWRTERALRLKRIEITSAVSGAGSRALVRRYHLRYDSASYHSLLTSLQLEGRPSRADTVYGMLIGERTVPESSLSDTIVGDLLPPITFAYSTPSAVAQVPGFGGIDSTVRRSLASPNHSADEGRVDFFDVNADGLDDILVTDPAAYNGGAGVLFNGFSASAPGTAGAFSEGTRIDIPGGLSNILNLANPNVIPMDVDGDGRGDLLHMPRKANYGYFVLGKEPTPRGSPYQPLAGWSFAHVTDLLPPGVTDPRIDLGADGLAIKTIDVNNDHLIDIVRTTGTRVQTWLNLGRYPDGEGRYGSASFQGNGWALSTDPVESCLLYAGQNLDFADPNVRITDMNGDGLSDIVKVAKDRVVWWPGRGEGAFGDGPHACDDANRHIRHIQMANPPLELNAELAGMHLVDVNHDGSADILQVGYDFLAVWFNKGGVAFSDRLVVDGTPFAVDALERVRLTDIDGSATVDVVYAEAGNYRWIDLMGGIKPRLLIGVDNGLGALTTLEYGSSAQDYLRDLQDSQSCDAAALDCFTWHREPLLPGASTADCDARLMGLSGMCVHRIAGSPVVSSVVRRMRTSDRLDALGVESAVSETEYRYHDGYYEGIEQEFRGFGAADAVALGDEYEPTSIHRTFFHQGRRPNEISVDRLADNPNEALKGREYLSEVFDERGKVLSTDHAAYAVRRLQTGLNGVNVSYAYVKQGDRFLYDTTGATGPSSSISLTSVVREEARPNRGVNAVYSAAAESGDDPHTVTLRSLRFARLQSSMDVVDNAGNLIQQTEWGRNGVGEYGEAVGDERVVTFNRSVLIPDASCSASGWLWRTTESYVADLTAQYRRTQMDYTACGDLQMTARIANLPSVGAFEFGGGGGAQAFTQTNDVEVSSSALDLWGQTIQTCDGGIVSSQAGNPCLRDARYTYDSEYQDVITSEATAVEGTPGSQRFLTTSAVWDRGLGAIESSTDPNGYVSEVSYDGLGRLTAAVRPGGQGCEGTRTPSVLIDYDITTTPASRPLSRVTTRTLVSCSVFGHPDNQIVAHTYVDGLGRSRVSLTEGETDSGAWDDGRAHAFTASGRTVLTKKGSVRLAYQAAYFDGSADDFRAVIARPLVPYSRVLFDAFGRPTLTVNEDNSYSSISYHALSRDLCDEVDNGFTADGSQAFRGTCTTERTDGHGRVIDRQQRQVTASGTRENHRLFMYYRADDSVTRVVRAVTGDNVLRPEGAMTGTYVERRFHYDSWGRRIASEDPDTDNRNETSLARRTWRYLYNKVGDLVAVRDPRGCGQNFYYDLAGRILGEAYVGCAEAQTGELPSADVPAASISLGLTSGAVNVHTRYYYDVYPTWAESMLPPGATGTLGRALAVQDTAQRSVMAYDARGNIVATSKQLAVIEPPADLPGSPSLDASGLPRFDGGDETGAGASTVLYDTASTYVRTSQYDHAGRLIQNALPSGASFGEPDMPTIGGRLHYYRNGSPRRAELLLGQTAHPVVARNTYTRDGLVARTQYGDGAFTGRAATESSTVFDARRRPIHLFTTRARVPGAAVGALGYVSTIVDQRLTWDGASNLVAMDDLRPGAEWPEGHKPFNQQIAHDALYRVAQVSYTYKGEQGAYDDATDWRDTEEAHRAADPMAATAPKMLPKNAQDRVMEFDYQHDWLANMTSWNDDGHMFYERSLGRITNGNDLATGASPARRPSALYLASNLDSTTPSDLGGWLEADYGRGGNLLAMTVHAQCTHASATSCHDPGGTDLAARRSALRAGCSCASEQHYVYRWDAINRLQEARRYDREGGGTWQYAARQRYRYDADNERTVKHTLAVGSSDERAALYVYPGEFERRGMVVDLEDGDHWESVQGEAESQYLVAGARVVWKTQDASSTLFDPGHRITMAIGNLVGSTSAVIDLPSGELLEATGFYPNGAREHWLAAEEIGPSPSQPSVSAAQIPLEPVGFTGKEADEEVGLTYFGQRYLVPRLGRWASPDPAEIHSLGGGESLNSYHYVAGNLLQRTDPLGLWPDIKMADVTHALKQAGRHAVALAVGTADAITDGRVSRSLMIADSANFASIMNDPHVQNTYAAASSATAVVQSTVGTIGAATGIGAMLTTGGTAAPVAAPVAIGGAALAAYGGRQMVKTADRLNEIRNFSKGAGEPPPAPKKYKGGRHEEMKGPKGDKLDSHHIPADGASHLKKKDGPAIQMEQADHRKTASHGMQPGSKAYIEKQRQLIKEGKFKEAQQMDIDDIRSKFGNKYDDAIEQMQKYTNEIPEEKLKPPAQEPTPAPTTPG